MTGVIKVMSKMGISTLHSYRGAQIFEAVGLGQDLVDRYFSWTPSRIGGIGIEEVARESAMRHERAWPPRTVARTLDLDVGGQYQWRRGGEHHLFSPLAIAKLQKAVHEGVEDHDRGRGTYLEYASLINDQARRLGTLRGLLRFKSDRKPIDVEDVEPASSIMSRFKTGAMSFGSISREAHTTLAVAMNGSAASRTPGRAARSPTASSAGRTATGRARRSSRSPRVASG